MSELSRVGWRCHRYLVCDSEALAVGLARVGSDIQTIKAGSISELIQADFGAPLHSVIIPGRLHELEIEMLKLNAWNRDTIDDVVQMHQALYMEQLPIE